MTTVVPFPLWGNRGMRQKCTRSDGQTAQHFFFSFFVNVQVYTRHRFKILNMYNCSPLTRSQVKNMRNKIFFFFRNEEQTTVICIDRRVRKQNFLRSSRVLSSKKKKKKKRKKTIDFSLISSLFFPPFFLVNAAITLLYWKEDEETLAMRNEEELQELTIVGEVCWGLRSSGPSLQKLLLSAPYNWHHFQPFRRLLVAVNILRISFDTGNGEERLTNVVVAITCN